jgi:hypothetical protein
LLGFSANCFFFLLFKWGFTKKSATNADLLNLTVIADIFNAGQRYNVGFKTTKRFGLIKKLVQLLAECSKYYSCL